MDKCDLPTFIDNQSCKKHTSRFLPNFSRCSSTILCKHITSTQRVVEDDVIKCCETPFSYSKVDYNRYFENSSEVKVYVTECSGFSCILF